MASNGISSVIPLTSRRRKRDTAPTAEPGEFLISGRAIPFSQARIRAPRTLPTASWGPGLRRLLANLGCYVSLNGKSILIPAAFGGAGNTAPNMFRSFPYYNVDLNVTKVFKVKERLSFQFRAEFFNIFNHPQIANRLEARWGQHFTDPYCGRGAEFRLQKHDA